MCRRAACGKGSGRGEAEPGYGVQGIAVDDRHESQRRGDPHKKPVLLMQAGPSGCAKLFALSTPRRDNSELTKIGVSDSEITQQRLSFPVYGNYCGFGHGDPTGNTPPIDAVDAVCRQHDACYALHGLFDSRCDRDLIESMPGAIANTRSPVGKKAGLVALLYFSLAERNLALGKTLFKKV